MSAYRLTIPRVPLSPNKLLGKHWSAKAKEKKLWNDEIWLAVGTRWVRFEATGKRKVTITLYNARQYDRDNAWASVKPILDAMVALGLLVDDASSYCELQVLQEKSTRKDKRTVIQVEPA